MSEKQGGDFARGLGIAAIIIGSFGLMFGWMPFFGVVGLPLAMLSIMIGLAGVVFGISSKSTGLPFAGMAIGVVVIVIQWFSFGGIGSLYNEYAEKAKQELNAAESVESTEDAIDRLQAERSLQIIEAEYLKRDGLHLVRVGVNNMDTRPIDAVKVEVRFMSQFDYALAVGNLDILTPDTIDVLMPVQPFKLPEGNYFVFDDIDPHLPIQSIKVSPIYVSFR